MSKMPVQRIGGSGAVLLLIAIYLSIKRHGWRKNVKVRLTKIQVNIYPLQSPIHIICEAVFGNQVILE